MQNNSLKNDVKKSTAPKSIIKVKNDSEKNVFTKQWDENKDKLKEITQTHITFLKQQLNNTEKNKQNNQDQIAKIMDNIQQEIFNIIDTKSFGEAELMADTIQFIEKLQEQKINQAIPFLCEKKEEMIRYISTTQFKIKQFFEKILILFGLKDITSKSYYENLLELYSEIEIFFNYSGKNQDDFQNFYYSAKIKKDYCLSDAIYIKEVSQFYKMQHCSLQKSIKKFLLEKDAILDKHFPIANTLYAELLEIQEKFKKIMNFQDISILNNSDEQQVQVLKQSILNNIIQIGITGITSNKNKKYKLQEHLSNLYTTYNINPQDQNCNSNVTADDKNILQKKSAKFSEYGEIKYISLSSNEQIKQKIIKIATYDLHKRGSHSI